MVTCLASNYCGHRSYSQLQRNRHEQSEAAEKDKNSALQNIIISNHKITLKFDYCHPRVHIAMVIKPTSTYSI